MALIRACKQISGGGLIVAVGLWVACCSPTVTDNRPISDTGSTDNGAVVPPTRLSFVDPWGRAQIGDTATYRTPRDSNGETWVLVRAGDAPEIQKTFGAGEDPITGEPEPGQTETIFVDPRPSATEPKWWSAEHPQQLPTEKITLSNGQAVEAYTVTTAQGVFVISDAVPFEGVVRFTPTGATTPTLELLGFGRKTAIAGNDPSGDH